jgi:ADP-L-glycero-D-manno-heptose 6-epimerase
LEKDFDYLWNNNVEYSKALFKFCERNKISFIYASSAATYGSGNCGFSDEKDINGLMPLNRYGYSKQAFDLWINRQNKLPFQCVGLKFFNVYGPNEYHKDGMFSMVYQGYKQVEQTGKIKLFKSYNTNYLDGDQKRDFVYVKDICKLVLWLIEHQQVSGLFNVGTGESRTFNDLARAVFVALNKEANIAYIDMPQSLTKQYQYYTQADISKLRKVGYKEKFYSLEDGVNDYVINYLLNDTYY